MKKIKKKKKKQPQRPKKYEKPLKVDLPFGTMVNLMVTTTKK